MSLELLQSGAIRAEFPGASKWTYLDVAGRGLLPLRTRRALDDYLDMRMCHGGDKAVMFATVERSRERFAAMVGASSDEIAITKNISEGLNIVAAAFPWQAGDNVVVCTEREHPNNIYIWHQLARRHDIEVRIIASRQGLVPTDDMIAAIDARTRIVSASTVTFVPGFRTDLDAVGQACRDRGALFLVDGAQSLGLLKLDVTRTPVDAIAASTQKGLLGLYGMGFLYCRREWAERLSPVYLARFGVDLGDAHEADAGTADYTLMRGARRFDLGNYNFAAAAAADSSMALLAEVGADAVEEHVVGLARHMAEALSSLGLPVVGLPWGPHFANIVTVGHAEGQTGADDEALARLHAHLVEARVKLSVRRGQLRFSFHIYNDASDVDRVLEVVRRWIDEDPSGHRSLRGTI